jgi:hypothetical protein
MKIRCEICGSHGQLQHLSKNYYRVKHYLGSVDGRLKFEYHKQSFQYVESVLNQSTNIDPIDPKTIDPRNPVSSSNTSLELGMGVEPTYSGSAGRRLDRSATPAPLHILKTEINTISPLQAFPQCSCKPSTLPFHYRHSL